MRRLLERLSEGNNLLVAAIALGVLTSALTYVLLSGSDDAPPPPAPAPAPSTQLEEAGDPVVVARDLIPAGTELTAPLIELIEVRRGTGADGTFDTVDEAVGRVTRFPLVRGEHVLASKLVGSEAETREGLAFSIPLGMRAVSVGFSEVMGAGGLVVPGDRVDVLISTRLSTMFGPGEVLPIDEDPDSPTVFVLMQNVLVLALGRTFTDPLESGQDPATLRIEGSGVPPAGTITLAVTPEQAQVLFFASDHGRLGLALRRFGDASASLLDPEFKLTPGGIPPVAGSGTAR